ncbi:DUF6473 family protein [Roseivivax marinus]|uniref:DUF6473 family protein n=1 Tax=Roseivivax marinus TaxID=1379903 RepID=UPI001F03A110|nr:DUF6473 family protein [Roseivivax marinus]UMA63908.1 DUF6473 family protein [Roseivivax marinus]
MSYASHERGGMEYYPCRYGASRITFRGPRKSCEGAFAAFLGGTETYGRFVPDPFVAQVERASGLPCVNFGVVNAGPDAFFSDPAVPGLAAAAAHVVIELTGAQNNSNRLYRVHPRRNDRFVKASDTLAALYPEIDFSEHAFTRGLLRTLLDADAERFALVTAELQAAWTARMKALIALLPAPVTLLWCAEAEPPETLSYAEGEPLGAEPLFVTRAMIDALAPLADDTVVYVRSDAARAAGTDGMTFSDFDAGAAGQLLGAVAHEEIAGLLAPLVARALQAA